MTPDSSEPPLAVGQPVRVKVDGDGYIYMASSAAGLEIFETSDPLAPTRVATVDVGGSALAWRCTMAGWG